MSVEQSPESCARCQRTVFNHQVCANCGWRPACPTCGGTVTGRADKVYCAERCKKRRWDRQNAPVTSKAGARQVLVGLSDPHLRELLRGVMVEREQAAAARAGREAVRGGRLRVRWGERQENA